jgi:glycosyltransferase involved in cell wall biosynthesis
MELDLPDRGRLGSARRTRRYEARLLACADAVWVVTPEERDYFVRTYAASPEKFVVVPNGNPRVPAPAPRSDGEPVRIVYPGSLYRDRENLRSVIAPLLARVTRPVTVTLAGPGGEWIDATFADPRVRWCGTLGDRECFDLVAASDIGLLAYFDDEPYYEIVHPTKLSLYLAATIPIVSGDARYVARFIREHGVGAAVSRAEFVAALIAAVDDPALRRRQSEAAQAIREGFFWDAILDRAAAETRRIAPVTPGV